jgi:hypothetical protein
MLSVALMVGVVEAMVDLAMVAVVVAVADAVVAAEVEDMVAAAVAKTIRIIIIIAWSMRPRRVTVCPHLLVEVEVFPRA